MNYKADVCVIGAGHAGCEAALAAARMGCSTVLFTISLDAVANMPCNPSVGGSAKGHIVYEIDSLGGEMGRCADYATIQSRTLNLGKGAAVRAKRVQADRNKYKAQMKKTLEKEKNLRLVQAEIVELLTDGAGEDMRVIGVKTHLGEIWETGKVVIAVGTFLESEIFVGDKVYSAGPDGMLPSRGLSSSLAEKGISLRRFKTGTPARVHRRSIDLSRLEEQSGEDEPIPFSRDSEIISAVETNKEVCHVVYTNKDTHRIILDNLSRSAMYSGNIEGTGPRYCPSIETKLVRFEGKERHQLFVEPCGLDTDEMYIQGFSTSMPTDVQYEMLRSLDGFENAEIMRYAYAIEYDCARPDEMYASLEFKKIRGLFGAGQFNGTSGYEEAAAQGLIAGINAALTFKGEDPLILSRDSSYIGTLIDDLVTKGTDEPYRMMTSRSEYRLLLRQDNADARLTPIGRRIGLIDDERFARFTEKMKATENEIYRIKHTNIAPTEEVNAFLSLHGSTNISTGIKLSELLCRPELDYEMLSVIDKDRPELPLPIRLSVGVEIKYEGYIKREEREAERQRKLDERKIPDNIDYDKIEGLRLEAREKLSHIRPESIGRASRISGVNPADISVLLIYLSSGAGECVKEGAET